MFGTEDAASCRAVRAADADALLLALEVRAPALVVEPVAVLVIELLEPVLELARGRSHSSRAPAAPFRRFLGAHCFRHLITSRV